MGYKKNENNFLEVYEFNTNTRTTIYSDGFVFLAPKSLLRSSSGVLIDGSLDYFEQKNVELTVKRRQQHDISNFDDKQENKSDRLDDKQERDCLIKCTRIDHVRAKWDASIFNWKQANEKCKLDCILSLG